jgi:hypothetical protein
MEKNEEVQRTESTNRSGHQKPHEAHIVTLQEEALEDARHINLSWRSWIVVFFCCWAYVLP